MAHTLTETSFLNRVTRRDPASGRAELEADTRHVAMVLRDLGLEKSSHVVALAAKRPKSEELLLLAEAKLLNAEDTTLNRSVTMRENNLSLDRPDLSFAAGSLARGMKSPTTKDLEELTRVGRSLIERATVGANVFEPQSLLGVLEVFCDADHAGDLGTRESRSGEAVMWRAHLIKEGSAVQRTIALSSGESEYYTLLRFDDWHDGVAYEIHKRCDSSAARSLSRQGMVKTRHVDVRFLWPQQAVQEGRVKVLSVPCKTRELRTISCVIEDVEA